MSYVHSSNELGITCDHELEVIREGAMHLEQAGWDSRWNLRMTVLKDLITHRVVGFLLESAVGVVFYPHTVWRDFHCEMTVFGKSVIILF